MGLGNCALDSLSAAMDTRKGFHTLPVPGQRVGTPLLLHLQRVLECQPSPNSKNEPRNVHDPSSHGDLHGTIASLPHAKLFTGL